MEQIPSQTIEQPDIPETEQIPVGVANAFEAAFLAGHFYYGHDTDDRFPGAVRLLYIALYHPNELSDEMPGKGDDVEYVRQLREMQAVSKYAPLSDSPIPSLEVFSQAIRYALQRGGQVSVATDEMNRFSRESLRNGMSFENSVYPEAKEALKKLWEEYGARVIIWTAGDSSAWEGQFHKVAGGKWGKLRNEVTAPLEKQLPPRQEMLSVVAKNNKMNYLKGTFEKLKSQGVTQVVLVEDKLKNLVTGMSVAGEAGVQCIPVWVRREGADYLESYPEKGLSSEQKEEFKKNYNAVGSFADVQSMLESNSLIHRDQKIGLVVDYDGVLHDDALGKRVWGNAITGTLIKNNWIQI